MKKWMEFKLRLFFFYGFNAIINGLNLSIHFFVLIVVGDVLSKLFCCKTRYNSLTFRMCLHWLWHTRLWSESRIINYSWLWVFSNEKHANLAAVHCWAKALLYSDSASFRGNYVVEIFTQAGEIATGIWAGISLVTQPISRNANWSLI